MAREFRTSPDFKTAVLANGSAGTSGQVLTSAGAGAAPSWTTVSGGGGLSQFVESEATASPNTTVPVDALTATDATYANIDVAFVAKGTGATLAQVPDGTVTGGNKRGGYATDWQKSRALAASVASGTSSVIGGGDNNSTSGNYSAISGGQDNTNTAVATYAFIGGGSGNSCSSSSTVIGGGVGNSCSRSFASVLGGTSNIASKFYSCVGGGFSNTASGDSSCIGGGSNNSATSNYALVPGGWQNIANAAASSVFGGAYGTTRGISGYCVFPANYMPLGGSLGTVQSALLNLCRQTTNGTPTVLASDSSVAGSGNQVILPNNAAYSFSGEVIAGVTGGGNTARWTISGAIKRGANAASTAMVGTPTVTMTHNDAGAAAWAVAVTADTTNGGIAVTVTGAAATTIRWVCRINTTEMSF